MTPTPPAAARDVLAFWFDTLEPHQWFVADERVDRHIAARFGALLPAARAGWLADWRDTPDGRLAEILVLDQFARNIHRGTAEAFAGDALARERADAAIAAEADSALPVARRVFVYMPFMHSESIADHDRAARLFDVPGMETQQHHEARHRAVLERFGRYPQRNAALGRESTAEEAAFLAEPGAAF
ncbi:DUF924 family protein [Salinisphaera sp. Q1T1-3]|uniref:DUF924 family protein n=1 Tax=Salinisphaera sp. Q1T1-3 TaxID=2321229 RepID=UPI000E719A72|nr:DUF924 family protein [Salinisphaera sp. Q1T1-3]RJS91042.1 DUF924 domain-containing protein [Salinisphaera sp. Q1T1-3]